MRFLTQVHLLQIALACDHLVAFILLSWNACGSKVLRTANADQAATALLVHCCLQLIQLQAHVAQVVWHPGLNELRLRVVCILNIVVLDRCPKID